jgi:hypothetical protein
LSKPSEKACLGNLSRELSPRTFLLRAGRGRHGAHRRPDHRHGSQCPALDGAWVARRGATVVVSLEIADLTEPELRQEILKLRRRVEKLAALLRLPLALLQTSGFWQAGRLERVDIR